MRNSPESIPIEARLAERNVPTQPVLMYQRWEELLFLHWPVESDLVARDLPPGLRVDTFEGKAWIGLVPFLMRKVRPRFLPAVPGLSDFPELNLRTYVIDAQGRPGVWFYSLDTPKRLPNWIAQNFFHLNYRLARMQVESLDSGCSYQSQLRLDRGWDSPQCYRWKRDGQSYFAKPGSLDFFLVERYRLFAYNVNRKQLMTGKVHHQPYSLEALRLDCFSKRLFETNGLPQPAGAPVSALASTGVDVRIFPMRTAGSITLK